MLGQLVRRGPGNVGIPSLPDPRSIEAADADSFARRAAELVPLPTSPPHIISPSNGSGPFDPNDSNFKPYLNWQDMGCLWVSIDHKSGLVSTAENNASATAFNNGGYGVANSTPGYGSYVELMDLRNWRSNYSAWEVVNMTRTINDPARRGISLIEVMFAAGILTVGILGMAALVPLGAYELIEATKLDQSSTAGLAAFRDLEVRGFLQPKLWVDTQMGM